MMDTNKEQEDATLATYQKMAILMGLCKDEAKKSLGGHKSHLTHTREAADKAVKALEDLPCSAPIKNMERYMESYYAKADAMESAYVHLLVLDPAESERWEREIKEIHKVKESMKEQWLPIVA